MTSLTHMATQSMPTVSCLSSSMAMRSLVPTPSVPEISTGWLMPVQSSSNRPPKPPRPPMQCSFMVRLTYCFISSTER